MNISPFLSTHRKLDNRFAKYLRGKSVAILGRGPSLASCSADVIDSYDVVVRVHRPAPIESWWPPPFVQPEWRERVGHRTDIFYTSFDYAKEPPDTEQVEFLGRMFTTFMAEGGSFICKPHPHYAVTDILANNRMRELWGELRYVGLGLYFNLWKIMGYPPFPGTLVVADILAHDVTSVFIGGMTCYCERHPAGIAEAGRMSKADFNFIRNCYRYHDNVSVDPMMEELFDTLDGAISACAPSVHELYRTDADGAVNNYVASRD